MVNTKEIKEPKIIKEYMDYHEEFSKKYADDKVLILMQVGGFYEAYSTFEYDDVENSKGRGPDLDKVSELTGAIKSQKGKKDNKPLSINAPFMLGFPMTSRDKFSEILVNSGYVVIIVDQVYSEKTKQEKAKEGGEERKITNIYTKGTFISNLDKNDGNYIAYAYISRDFQKDFSPLLSVGLAAIDVSTGQVLVHEAYSNKYDEYYALDETDRFFTSLNPKEIVIYFNNNGKDKSNQNFRELILNYLKLDEFSCKFINKVDKKYFSTNVQNEILNIVYPVDKSMLGPICQLDLERNIYCIVSLTILFDTIYDKNKNFLNNLIKPVFFISEDHLTLGNNAITQLDVIESNKDTTKAKYRSLFHVINQTSTPLGERFLKTRLLSPLLDKEQLNELYNLTEILVKDKLYEKIEKFLTKIKDIERLQRKMELQILKPLEISHILSSYESISQLVNFIKIQKSDILTNLLPSKKSIEEFKKFNDYVNSRFIVSELNKYVLLDIETQIFQKEIHPDVDVLENSTMEIKIFFEKICNELNKLVDVKSGKKPFITLQKTAKKGYYFKTTNLKAELLKPVLLKKKICVDKNNLDNKNFKFLEMGGTNTKISLVNFDVDDVYDDPVKCKEKFMKLTRKYYIEELTKIFFQFKTMFFECSKFISNIDFIKSSAKVAVNNGYTRPKIVNKKYGYISAKKLRHPIIETIINFEYIPHDIDLGEDLKGMMIYGLNGAGKCFDPNTKIMMFDNTIKMAKDIKINDKLMGDDSTPRNVLSTTTGNGQMYKIIPTNKSDTNQHNEFIVNGPHILCLMNLSNEIIEITVDNYLKKNSDWKDNYCMYKVELDYPEKEVDIDPYILGYWLGDGTKYRPEIIKYFTDYFEVKQNISSFHFVFINFLKKYKLLGKNKRFIPDDFKFTSRKNRMAILAGLIDSDGYNTGTSFDICLKSKTLINDIIFLARSLGFTCYLSECEKNCTIGANGPDTGKYYRTNILGTVELFKKVPLLLEYKRPTKERESYYNPLKYSFKIEKLKIQKYCGFEVDKNKRFLLEDFTVTHNSGCMKAVGLCAILAQAGLFVPCDSLTISPYSSLYTRISGDDNIFRGLSSFSLEMVELNAILKRANKKTLVIGDEICRGTEHISGNALVGSAIISLSEVESSFIFASHLHEIMEFDEIKEIPTVKAFHLSVKCDSKNGLVYDRTMKEGCGEKIYGVVVAQNIVQDKKFIDMAVKLRNKLTESYDGILSGKKSKYNKNIMVYACHLCGTKDRDVHISNLETHHINFQSNCENGVVTDKKHLKKNNEANLIVLCNDCHDKIHAGKIVLDKYIMTSEGRKIIIKDSVSEKKSRKN
jgi:DNA mismatch repair protein MutS